MRVPIGRDLDRAEIDTFDMIVIGGGIYGACLTLESARRGLRVLLLERDDFGGATSGNSLRILHGGFRYLQNLDPFRLRQSVRERNWFQRHFPDLVEPLACLMPLYSAGLRRPAVMRVALTINDFLSRDRNRGVAPDRQLQAGSTLGPEETIRLFPRVDQLGLRGGARWSDALMRNSPRLLIDIVRWACGAGATALNYVEARGLLTSGGRVSGIEAQDHVSDRLVQIKAPVVVNCAGPWCREVSARLDREIDRLFFPSLAFNILLNKPSLSTHAVAVTPKRKGARTYFLLPHKNRIFAGTYHTTWTGSVGPPQPDRAQLLDMISDLNEAVPQLDASLEDVMRIYAGLLPTAQAGSHVQGKKPLLHDHGAHGGPHGLISMSGVKYTTARAVAEDSLRTISRYTGRMAGIRPDTQRDVPTCLLDLQDYQPATGCSADDFGRQLRQLVDHESVMHLDDLLLRRTDWPEDGSQTLRIAHEVAGQLDWSPFRQSVELDRLEHVLAQLGMTRQSITAEAEHVR